jgi:Tfp pilus assembly protein PilN
MTSQPLQQVAEVPEAPEVPTAPAVNPVDWAPVPKVNLLPPEILARRKFRKVRIRLAFVVVLTVLVASGAVAWSIRDVSAAQTELDATAARTVTLRQTENKYSEVPHVLAQVEAVKTARQRALATDVLWYRFLTDVSNATPANVSLQTLTIALNGETDAAASSDALTPSGIGTVTIVGTAATINDVAAWMDAVVRVHGIDASTLKSATRDTGSTSSQVSFSATVVVTSQALSHRFDVKAG